MEGSIVQRSKGKLLIALAIGLGALFLLLIMSWSLGAVDIGFSTVLDDMGKIFSNFGPAPADAEQQIIWSRMVRSLAVIGVGIGLSVAGVVMQALIRNPLVDPYITGVSSGAALGAILSILAGISIVSLAEFTTPVAALIGAVGAFFLTLTWPSRGGRSVNFVLSGMIIGIAISCNNHRPHRVQRQTTGYMVRFLAVRLLRLHVRTESPDHHPSHPGPFLHFPPLCQGVQCDPPR